MGIYLEKKESQIRARGLPKTMPVADSIVVEHVLRCAGLAVEGTRDECVGV